MPRLDNSDQGILALIRTFNSTGSKANNIQFDPKDPGATDPVDVCHECLENYFRLEEAEVDHPPYNEMAEDDYRCIMCGRKLEEERDG